MGCNSEGCGSSMSETHIDPRMTTSPGPNIRVKKGDSQNESVGKRMF